MTKLEAMANDYITETGWVPKYADRDHLEDCYLAGAKAVIKMLKTGELRDNIAGSAWFVHMLEKELNKETG